MNKIWQIINVEKSYWTDTLSPWQMSTCSESSICTVACEHKGSHLSKQTYNNKFCVQEPPVWSRILHITSACAQLHRTDINKSYIFQSDLLVHGHIQKCPQITIKSTTSLQKGESITMCMQSIANITFRKPAIVWKSLMIAVYLLSYLEMSCIAARAIWLHVKHIVIWLIVGWQMTDLSLEPQKKHASTLEYKLSAYECFIGLSKSGASCWQISINTTLDVQIAWWAKMFISSCL